MDPLIDRALGLDTGGFVPVANLGLDREQAFDYRAAGWRALQVILDPRDVDDSDVFVDFGCGKGRILFLAARYRFARIIGVELSDRMASTARRNLARDSRVVVENANAADWPVPPDVTFTFFHNPFPNAIFESVINNLVTSLQRHPRRLWIIYRRPHRMHSFLLDSGFELIRQTKSGPTNLYRFRSAEQRLVNPAEGLARELRAPPHGGG